ncbi:putative clusterin associated protein 1 [Operophtera brumata]|uniref:Putative clusterin associated protein 1 n=1 Tax=Operophtera brumata TaxID=104452 RepID=A0A0L7L4G4_OPEBR|nr:putative clusterin associated protein 1 [Operophtera brumata]
MSYRDLRNFSEAMRVLGFPKPISLESFRIPNWELMEECLRWLASRVEPDSSLPRASSMEQRVSLVSQAIALFHSRANVKLNGKRLYGADGWAVRELLKVASFLRAALSAPPPAEQRDEGALSYDVSSRLGEIKQARSLATEITAQGAFLYDLLAKEAENKYVLRYRCVEALKHQLSVLESAQAELEGLWEQCVLRYRCVEALKHQLSVLESAQAEVREHTQLEGLWEQYVLRYRCVEALKHQLSVLESAQAEVREHTQLEGLWEQYVLRYRCVEALKHQLSVLESAQAEVREHTQLEGLWEQYVLRYRCVEALNHQLSVLESAQAEEAEEQQAAIMQLIHKYEAEDVLGKLSDSEDMESSDDEKDLSEAKQPRPATRPKTRLRIKTAGTVW